jgi:microcystin-dependent protein
MATITGLTAERMLEIEGSSVVSGEMVDGDLILTKHDGTEINAGPVSGPAGPPGPAGISAIPGEVKLWPGDTLPDITTYGNWVWADGAVYLVADYPLAADHIASQWRTFGGASDPGGTNFRVPDLRGLVAAGLDAMPGGTRANRMTRSVAITIAEKTGTETHVITIPQMARHAHGGNVVAGGAHYHGLGVALAANQWVPGWSGAWIGSMNAAQLGNDLDLFDTVRTSDFADHSHPINLEGDNVAHENVQPTVFVPYIVCLDG